MNFLSNFVLVAALFLEALCLNHINAVLTDGNSHPSFSNATQTESSNSDPRMPKVMSLIPTSSLSSSSSSATVSAGKKVGIFPNHGVSQTSKEVSGSVTQYVWRLLSYTADGNVFLSKTSQKTTQTSSSIIDWEYDDKVGHYIKTMNMDQYIQVQPNILSQSPVDYNLHSTLQVEQWSVGISGSSNQISQVVITCNDETVTIPKLPTIVQLSKGISGGAKQRAVVMIGCERYCSQPISVTQVGSGIYGSSTQSIELYYNCPKGAIPTIDLYQNSGGVSGKYKGNLSVFMKYK